MHKYFEVNFDTEANRHFYSMLRDEVLVLRKDNVITTMLYLAGYTLIWTVLLIWIGSRYLTHSSTFLLIALHLTFSVFVFGLAVYIAVVNSTTEKLKDESYRQLIYNALNVFTFLSSISPGLLALSRAMNHVTREDCDGFFCDFPGEDIPSFQILILIQVNVITANFQLFLPYFSVMIASFGIGFILQYQAFLYWTEYRRAITNSSVSAYFISVISIAMLSTLCIVVRRRIFTTYKLKMVDVFCNSYFELIVGNPNVSSQDDSTKRGQASSPPLQKNNSRFARTILSIENLAKHSAKIVDPASGVEMLSSGGDKYSRDISARDFYYHWTKHFSRPGPSCRYARPPMSEVAHLLPIAYRLNSFIAEERSNGSNNVVFDMNGLTLEPPFTGPFFGAPVGGLGSGAMGRGYAGEFRRFSLDPGKLVNKTIHANQFSIRVKRGSVINSKVLSVATNIGSAPTSSSLSGANERSDDAVRAPPPLLSTWNWGLNPLCATYHALFPLSTTVYDEPVPGVKVSVHQVAPLIPHNYSDSSLPAAFFMVDVENLGVDAAEVSVMFTFQNGLGVHNEECCEHRAFEHTQQAPPPAVTDIDSNGCEDGALEHVNIGILMTHKRVTGVVDKRGGVNTSYEDTNSIAIAAACDSADTVVSYNKRFVVSKSEYETGILSGARRYIHDAVLSRSGGSVNSASDSSASERLIGNDYAEGTASSPSPSSSAARLWKLFHCNGAINEIFSNDHRVSDSVENGDKSEVSGSAICVKKVLEPRSVATFSFSLAFSHPIARFGSGSFVNRQFTRFVGCSPASSALVAVYALQQGRSWLGKIQRFHAETIEAVRRDSSVSRSFQHADAEDDEGRIVAYIRELFNELYFLVDGGSIWSTETPLVHEDLRDLSRALLLLPAISLSMAEYSAAVQTGSGERSVVGRFLYLEGMEYLMYNTYDVHFYSSFALVMLWPQLELSIQRDFAFAVAASDETPRCLLGDGKTYARKRPGGVPHDIGSPFEAPWEKLNSYNLQDVTNWKDLNSKFVLQTFRDYQFISRHPLTADTSAASTFLSDLFSIVLDVMAVSERNYDLDHDGMIENSGFPDQTYDIWSASGVHAYCGGLWIAACSATAAMAKVLGDSVNEKRYLLLHTKAQAVYVSRLWNGSYLLYDSSSSHHSDSIMADSMCGHAYSRLCGLPAVLPSKVAVKCYTTIFTNNVVKFSEIAFTKNKKRRGGASSFIGAVNGMRPNGTIDQTCMHSREVWTGVTYLLAAGLLAESHEQQRWDSGEAMDSDARTDQTATIAAHLRRMAFDTANGIANGKELFGYHFNTPEAWESDGAYRSAAYMRPLSVWAIQYSIDSVSEGRQQQGRGNDDIIEECKKV